MSDGTAIGGSGPLTGRALVPGVAEGAVLYSSEPLSFWGGYDAETGEIIDRRHPLAGRNGAGRILAIPATRGSSTTTAVLLEAIRRGTAPAALLTRGPDTFLALAAIVAAELYGRAPPVVALSPSDFDALRTTPHARVEATGVVTPL
ncbi:aconitase X swivel domain-containing protein [Candidatus Palauibacter sp.]|uniref:aconitase X swivel domain-containing protein n=1 Tax=Candidatus Palauibacter sp. TaxID=3101350 RepID=UPI003CC6B518